MANYIQNILSNVLEDGARSAKFECYINFRLPDGYDSRKVGYLVKTSKFPGKSHDLIDFKYKGRSVPIKGQVKYDGTWTCTFYLTEDHKLKKAFEDWIESIDQIHNYYESSVLKPREYLQTFTITQLDFDLTPNNPKAGYILYNCFPISITPVDVDYSAVGNVLEFSVEFAYSHFEYGNNLDDIRTLPEENIQAGSVQSSDELKQFIQSPSDMIT